MLLLQGQRLEGDGEVSLAVTAAQLHRPARAESFMGEEFGDPMLLAGKDMHDLVLGTWKELSTALVSMPVCHAEK